MADHLFGIQQCASCRYAKADNPLMKNSPIGCRRHPPQVVIVPVQTPQGMGVSSQAVWPTMQRTDGCGDGLPVFTPTIVGEASPLPAGQVIEGES